jgi:hypothetical protein
MNRRTASSSIVLNGSTVGSARVARAHDRNRPERPWSAATEAKSADPRIRAMAYAILAPNAFNLQPWLAELPGDDMLVLRCDLTRRLPEADAEDRMTVIGFGNFLELLRMAAGQEGYRLAIKPFPMGEPTPQLDDRPIASVRFIRGGAEADPLFAQVPERRTCKQPFEPRPVSSSDLQQVCSVGVTAAELRASNESGLVGRIRDVAAQAFGVEKHTPRVNQEQVRVTRIGAEEIEACPDGIDMQGAEVEAALRQGDLSRKLLADPESAASQKQLRNYRALCHTAAAYIWLSTKGNTRHDQLDAGRDWLRIHLKATELGLSYQPQSPALNDYQEVLPLFYLMHETLGISPGRRAQMLGRLGYAAQTPPTARWAVEAKILNP